MDVSIGAVDKEEAEKVDQQNRTHQNDAEQDATTQSTTGETVAQQPKVLFSIVCTYYPIAADSDETATTIAVQ
ncbi:MAG: hypothetical protein ACI4EV_03970 [Lachnospiraceae bacterium]